MRQILLLFLAVFASFTTQAQSPSLTAEQTVRLIYQNYKSDASAPYFGATGEQAITSERIQKVLTLNDNLTLPGNIGWLDYDPICDCQDFGDLVLESVAITQIDADHADAVVRFRAFKDDKEKTTQTLKMVAENDRWVIDDIASNHGSVWQAVNSENEKIPQRWHRCKKNSQKLLSVNYLSILPIIAGPRRGLFPTLIVRPLMPSIKLPSKLTATPMKICKSSGNLFTIIRSVLAKKRYFLALMKSVYWRKPLIPPASMFVLR